MVGCATKGDLRDVRTEIGELADQQSRLLAELERQSRITVDTLRTQSNQLFDLRGNINQALQEMRTILREVRELSGQNQRTIAQLRDQVAQLQRSMRTGGGMAGSGPVGAERAADETPEALYRSAMEAFNRDSRRAAELGFQQFIEAFPDHELTPLAHYNLADVYTQDERFREAIEEFSKVPERFPTDPKVADALYRVGLIYLDELGQPEEARRYLERVVNTYPESAPAALAEERLQGMGGGPP